MEPRKDAPGVVIDTGEATLADRAWYNYMHTDIGFGTEDEAGEITLNEEQTRQVAEAYDHAAQTGKKLAKDLHEELATGNNWGLPALLFKKYREQKRQIKQKIHDARATSAVYHGMGVLMLLNLEVSKAQLEQSGEDAVAS